MRTVRNRITVRSATTTKVVPLHDTLEALADRRARHIYLLPWHEMISCDLYADIEQVFGRNPKLSQLHLRLHRGLGKMATHRLAYIPRLRETGPELNGRVTVLVLGTLSHDLAIFHAKNGYGNVFAGLCIDPRHSNLLSNY